MRYSSIILAFLLVLTSAVTLAHRHTLIIEREAERSNLAKLYSERMQSVIDETVKTSHLLKEVIIDTNGNLDDSVLALITKLIYDADKYFCISYQPNGLVQYIYSNLDITPLLGQNAFELDVSKQAAKKAKETGETLLTGPYSILYDDLATVVVRTPVFFQKNDKKEFWGFVVIPIYTSYIIKQIGISALPSLDYQYSIETSYKDSVTILHTSSEFDKKDNYVYNFKLADGDWNLFISGSGGHIPNYQELIILALISSIFSFIIYFIILYFEQQHRAMKEMALTDSLTKLKNKKALESYIEENKKTKIKPFALFYIDLNFFKPVNDTYGYEIGDRLLLAFSERLTAHFKKGSFIARVGGDEFIVIVHKKLEVETCNSIVTRIISISEKEFFINGLNISISSSVGFARYPQDAISFEKVQDIADKAMQRYKQKNRKGR